jgi:hypothetical protein
MRRIIALLLSITLLPSCDLARPFIWNRKIHAADEAIARKIETLHLARLRTPPMKPIEPRTQVVVRAGGIDVYNAALVADLWDSRLRPLAGRLEKGYMERMLLTQEKVVILSAGKLRASDLRDGPAGFMIEPLFEALSKAGEIEESYSELVAKELRGELYLPGRLGVLIEESIPYETAAKVLYTAGQAEYGSYQLIAAGPDGLQAVPLEAPKFCEASSPAKTAGAEDPGAKKSILEALGSSPMGGAQCAEPAMHIGAKGIMVLAMSGSPDIGCKIVNKQEPLDLKDGAEAAQQESMPFWHNVVMLGPHKECPSVPRQDGKLDLPGLRDLLLAMKAMAPGCQEGIVSASFEIRWGEVISVMETAMADGGFTQLMLAVTIEDEENAEACAQGIQPLQLKPGAP